MNHDLTTQNRIDLSRDPEEAKLAYFTEESLYHVFHALFHKIWSTIDEKGFLRTYELFYYTHQQMIRR